MHAWMSGTPATVCAMAPARCSYCRSSWARSVRANRTKPISTVAVRIASWAMKIWVDSLRVEKRHTWPIITADRGANNRHRRAQNAQNPGKRDKRGMRAKQ